MAPQQIKEKRPSALDFEVDSQDLHLQAKLTTLTRVDGARTGLTLLALLMGIAVLGVSADTLHVYDATSVPQGLQDVLPLWPQSFNLRPTVALVVGAVFVVFTNIVSLLCSRVTIIRNRTVIHTSQSMASPVIGLIAAVIAMVFFYAINASTTEDTLISWTCRWKALSMTERPHFSTLCKESWAGLYLAILLIPVEAGVLAAAVWQAKLEKSTSAYTYARDSRSPSLRGPQETSNA